MILTSIALPIFFLGAIFSVLCYRSIHRASNNFNTLMLHLKVKEMNFNFHKIMENLSKEYKSSIPKMVFHKSLNFYHFGTQTIHLNSRIPTLAMLAVLVHEYWHHMQFTKLKPFSALVHKVFYKARHITILLIMPLLVVCMLKQQYIFPIIWVILTVFLKISRFILEKDAFRATEEILHEKRQEYNIKDFEKVEEICQEGTRCYWLSLWYELSVIPVAYTALYLILLPFNS